jgi:hypothetical protein
MKLHSLYHSSNIESELSGILSENLQKETHERPSCRWQDNVKTDLCEMLCDGMAYAE